MGNIPSDQHELFSSVAANVLANSANAQALNLAGLFQSVTQPGAGTAATAASSSITRGKKHQCRWCIETFDKRWNKDRHEDRKHAVELQAANDASRAAEAASPEIGRKRPCSELAVDTQVGEMPTDNVQGSISPSGRLAKQGRISEEEEQEPAAEAEAVAPAEAASTAESISMESGAETSDEEVVKLKIAQNNQEREDSEARQSGILFDESTRKELEEADAHISACCMPFLSWLCAPAVTESERLVKARRVDPKQLAPVKKNLAFLIKSLLGTKLVELYQLKLDVFTQKAVCEQLNTFLEERQAGASRIYALFLLIKKILVYLSSSESVRRREYIAPNTWNSWTVVDSICSDSNTRRKQISRDRKLLGAEQCKHLQPAPARAVPTAEDLKMPALYGEKKQSKAVVTAPAGASGAGSAGASTQSSSVHSSSSVTLQLRVDANELSPAELRQVAQGCLEFLNRPAVHENARFVAYLVTATLCFAMAPRQQVLRQLQIGSSFVKKDDGRYHVIMLAHMNKNGRATTFPIGQELTKAYDLYLGTIRPRLLGTKSHDYVFCKQTGDAPGPTFDFSDWTRSVCKELLARPVNCHAFRGALVTTYHKSGATQSEMNALADVMAHDPATAREYYYKDDAQRQASDIHERMRQAYNLMPVEGVALQQAPSQATEVHPAAAAMADVD